MSQTKKNAATKAATVNPTTATKASTPAAAAQDTTTKAQPAPLSVVESYSIAAALLAQHHTTSAIKATAAALREEYGPRNWATIWASIKDLRAKDITAAAADVRAVVLDYTAALETEYKRAAAAGKWADLMEYARNQWSTGAAFIAANYPHTINGQPAAAVNYITSNGRTILIAYQPQPRDARRAVSDIAAALAALERATKRASNAGRDTDGVTATTSHTAGAVVAAYNVAQDEDGRAIKGAPVTAAELEQLTKASTAGLETLKDWNASRNQ